MAVLRTQPKNKASCSTYSVQPFARHLHEHSRRYSSTSYQKAPPMLRPINNSPVTLLSTRASTTTRPASSTVTPCQSSRGLCVSHPPLHFHDSPPVASKNKMRIARSASVPVVPGARGPSREYVEVGVNCYCQEEATRIGASYLSHMFGEDRRRLVIKLRRSVPHRYGTIRQ